MTTKRDSRVSRRDVVSDDVIGTLRNGVAPAQLLGITLREPIAPTASSILPVLQLIR
jgi:hypothetical protein